MVLLAWLADGEDSVLLFKLVVLVDILAKTVVAFGPAERDVCLGGGTAGGGLVLALEWVLPLVLVITLPLPLKLAFFVLVLVQMLLSVLVLVLVLAQMLLSVLVLVLVPFDFVSTFVCVLVFVSLATPPPAAGVQSTVNRLCAPLVSFINCDASFSQFEVVAAAARASKLLMLNNPFVGCGDGGSGGSTSSTAPATDCPVLLLAALVGAVPVKHLLLFLLAVVKGPADGIGAAAAAGIEAAVACGGSVAVASALPVLSATVSDDCIWPLYGWRHR